MINIPGYEKALASMAKEIIFSYMLKSEKQYEEAVNEYKFNPSLRNHKRVRHIVYAWDKQSEYCLKQEKLIDSFA